MRVIICGAGQVGYGIAERLAAEQNDVSVIDTSPELIRTIRDQLDVRGFVGHGAHPDVLELAGAQQADMFIAVTLYDEVNMTACQVAHSLFNIPTKIARIRAQAYLQPHYQNLFSRENLPIDVIISPEIEVGEMVLRRIALPGATDVVRFADDKVAMVAIECLEECPVINTPLSQLSDLFPDLPSTVVGVWRNNRLFIPHSADQLVAGDVAYVVTTKEQVRRTLGLFGHEETEALRIVIGGGGYHGGSGWDGGHRRGSGWDGNHRRGSGWHGGPRYGRGVCAPGHALQKARGMGIRHARIVDVNHRVIRVDGRDRGGWVRAVFANDRGCPVVRVR
jgi:trk system potassium uptake protein TrkA